MQIVDALLLKLQFPAYCPLMIAKHPFTFANIGLAPVYVRFATRRQAAAQRFSGTFLIPCKMHDVVGGSRRNALAGGGGVIGCGVKPPPGGALIPCGFLA